jgi:hypothetical protein
MEINKDIWFDSDGVWVAEISTLQGNIIDRFSLPTGEQYNSVSAFLNICTAHFDRESDITKWTFGDKIVILND